MTYEDILVPSWCNYPKANMGLDGCWSLISGNVTSKRHCRKCDLYNNKKIPVEEEEKINRNQLALRAFLALQNNEDNSIL